MLSAERSSSFYFPNNATTISMTTANSVIPTTVATLLGAAEAGSGDEMSEDPGDPPDIPPESALDVTVLSEEPSPQSGNGASSASNASSKPFACEQCAKSFKRRWELHRHMRVHTEDPRPFQCPDCGKFFQTKTTLSSHQRIHTDEKPFQCGSCDKSFKRKGEVTLHMRTHTGERPFQCPYCFKGFKQKGTLTQHLPTHSAARPYYCNKCPNHFKHKSSLTRHMRTHVTSASMDADPADPIGTAAGASVSEASSDTEEDISDDPSRSPPGTATALCPICGVLHSSDSSYLLHMSSHALISASLVASASMDKGEPRAESVVEECTSHRHYYACGECDRGFKHWSSLQQHSCKYHSSDAPTDSSADDQSPLQRPLTVAVAMSSISSAPDGETVMYKLELKLDQEEQSECGSLEAAAAHADGCFSPSWKRRRVNAVAFIESDSSDSSSSPQRPPRLILESPCPIEPEANTTVSFDLDRFRKEAVSAWRLSDGRCRGRSMEHFPTHDVLVATGAPPQLADEDEDEEEFFEMEGENGVDVDPAHHSMFVGCTLAIDDSVDDADTKEEADSKGEVEVTEEAEFQEHAVSCGRTNALPVSSFLLEVPPFPSPALRPVYRKRGRR